MTEENKSVLEDPVAIARRYQKQHRQQRHIKRANSEHRDYQFLQENTELAYLKSKIAEHSPANIRSKAELESAQY